MNKTFNVRFILRKPRNQAKDNLPVYMRLTIDGARTEFATKRKVDLKVWHNGLGRVTGRTEESKLINHYFDLLQANVFDAEEELLKAGQLVSIHTISDKLEDKQPVLREKMLLEVFQYHNDQFEELVKAGECAIGTWKKFKSAYTSLEAFIQWTYNKTDYPITQLNHQFVTEYEFYLKTIQKVQHNPAMGNIKKLKKIVRLCVANEWPDKNPFMSYKITTRETHRKFLLKDELALIASKEFSTARLEQVKDIFLFSCYTGLAYSDVVKLSPGSIVKGIDDELWIYTTRTKTGTDSKIPLLPLAQSILNKYKHHPKAIVDGTVFPKISNQRMNTLWLKIILSVTVTNESLHFYLSGFWIKMKFCINRMVPENWLIMHWWR